jgi:hypothetical protein
MADFARLVVQVVRSLAGGVLLLLAAATLWRIVTTQAGADLLRWEEPANYAMASLACALLVGFTVVMPGGRRWSLLILLVLLALLRHVDILLLTWPRIASMMVAMVVVIFITEVVRQNVGLVRELREHNLGSKARNAFLIWLLIMGAASAVGFMVADWLTKRSTQLVYDQTPIDEYCEKGKGSTDEANLLDHARPCEGARWPIPPAVDELGLGDRLSHHWDNKYRSKQQQMLDHIASADQAKRIPDEVFMNGLKLKAALIDIDDLTHPVLVLEIPGSSKVTEMEALARDPDLQRMLQERTRIQATMKQGGWRRVIPIVVGNEQLKRLNPKIDQRAKAVLKASESVRTTDQIVAGSVQDQLLRRLPKVVAFPGPPILPVKEDREVAAVRSRLAALVVHRLAEQRNATIKVALEIAKGVTAERQKNPSGISAPEVQFEQIGFSRICTSRAASPDVMKEDLSDINGKRNSDLEYVPINSAAFSCSTDPAWPDTIPGKRLNLNESLGASIRQWTINNEVQLESSIRDALVVIVDDTNKGGARAQDLATMVPATIHLGRKRCRTLEPQTWGNCATNWIKEKAEKSYASGRAEAGQEYKLAVDKFQREGQGGAAGLVLYERDNGRNQLLQAEKSLHQTVRTVGSIVRVISWMLLLLLVITLIKSLLYVQALFLFHFRGPAVVQVNRSARIVGNAPKTAAPGDALLFEGVSELDPIVNQVPMDDQMLHVALAPWPGSGVVSRLLHLKYLTYNSGAPVYPNKPMAWQCPDGHNIVDWKLQPGEEVVFKYKHFMGASRSITLKSHVSLRLDTMLLGRFTFHSALAGDAPGHLLLQTKALSRRAVKQDAIQSAAPERIIAWHAQTGFTVAHQLNAWSLIMDPFALVRKPVDGVSGRMLVESSNRRVWPFAGLARHVLKVLSPI